MRIACQAVRLLLLAVTSTASVAADITFVNTLGRPINLHLRVGAIGSPPETRGASNVSVGVGASQVENVNDGDAWFAYGNQVIGGDDNPALCHAAGGETVTLTELSPTAANGEPCFVAN